MRIDVRLRRIAAVAVLLSATPYDTATPQSNPAFTAAQVDAGEATYQESCARCHGASLTSGPSGPPLLANSFIQRWAGRPLAELFSFLKRTMPPDHLGTLSDSDYAAVIAYILSAYGFRAAEDPLPNEINDLRDLLMPNREILQSNLFSWGGGLAPGIRLPEWPVSTNPLDTLSRVSDAMLATPPASSWLSWRRTQDAGGFSPLREIDKKNVVDLQVAWTLALPPGPSEATPLIHDGVMFVHSVGDHIQALDATTGDELWHYHPESSGAAPRKNIALYEDKLYFTTTNSRLVALETKTGREVWTWSSHDAGIGRLTGAGPTVADAVVMQGAASPSGAGSIIGLAANDGKLLWQFHTVPKPEEPNGNSWNGLAPDARSGGTVWMPGSYDAKRGLALFGAAPTDDILPLRNLVDEPGITNDALYTNTTIALEPRTGKLAWFYQHLPNDQWDLDWAFERQIANLTIEGKPTRVIFTGGKAAIYDALDADTGRYLFSIDLGLQNIVTGIDPASGRKTIDRNLTPGTKDSVTVCPHALGAKNWLPGAYNPENQTLYVPLVESCMDMIRVRRHSYIGGIRWTLRPLPGSDGKYGRLQAINLQTRRTTWIERQRAPQTSGVLVTAGGIVFAGALDRWFTAYNADTGDRLWRIRLSDVPNSSPISYSAKGKQYIAIVVGHGGSQSVAFLPLVPEIRLPAAHSSAVWVFELPDRRARPSGPERSP